MSAELLQEFNEHGHVQLSEKINTLIYPVRNVGWGEGRGPGTIMCLPMQLPMCGLAMLMSMTNWNVVHGGGPKKGGERGGEGKGRRGQGRIKGPGVNSTHLAQH